jgi:hypothetical protein
MSYQRTLTWPLSGHALGSEVIDEPTPDIDQEEWKDFESATEDDEDDMSDGIADYDGMAGADAMKSKEDNLQVALVSSKLKLRCFRKSLARRWARFSSDRMSEALSKHDWTLTADKPQEEIEWEEVIIDHQIEPMTREEILSHSKFIARHRRRAGRKHRNSFQHLKITLQPVLESYLE